MKIRIEELGIMAFPEASSRWNKERSYVLQQYTKCPEKFLQGSVTYIGGGSRGIHIITREGMEHLMGQTEEQANSGTWLVRHIKNSMMDFNSKVDSEKEAREMIQEMVSAELEHTDFTIEFEQIRKKPIKVRVLIRGNSVYTYEKK